MPQKPEKSAGMMSHFASTDTLPNEVTSINLLATAQKDKHQHIYFVWLKTAEPCTIIITEI